MVRVLFVLYEPGFGKKKTRKKLGFLGRRGVFYFLNVQAWHFLVLMAK